MEENLTMWSLPPRIKIPEAMGTLADERYEFIKDNELKIFSSSLGKYYTVKINLDAKQIMANDNGSFWVGYLGYPSVVMLMLKGVLKPDMDVVNYFKGIKWKDLNTKYKNDFNKTWNAICEDLSSKGYDLILIEREIDRLYDDLKKLEFYHLGSKTRPPLGY